MKKALLLVLSLMLLISMTGLAGAESHSEKKVFATILQTNTDWNMALATHCQKICDEYGWEQIVMTAEGDIQKMIDLVQSAISQKVDGMFIHSLDDNALTPYVASAIDNGIYVFMSTTGVPELIGDSYVNSGKLYCDNYDHITAAKLAAEAMANAIDGKGKVAILAGTAGAMNTNQRTQGFVDYMQENCPDIEIVNTINVDWDQILAMSTTEDLLASNPDLAGVYAMGEDIMVGAVEAVKDAGASTKVVGIDASTKIVQMVLDGDIAAVVNCRPSAAASGCVIMKRLMNGEPIDNIDGIVVDGIVYGEAPVCFTKDNASLDQVDY